MKKFFIAIIAMLLSLMAGATEINGINYSLDSSTKTASVSQGSYSGNVIIPSQVTYNGVTYTVTSIAGQSFYGSNVTSVTIPNTVKVIPLGAFQYCNSLTSITIPSSVTKLEEESLGGFTGVIHITDLEAWCKTFVHPAAFYDSGCYRLYLNGKEITDLVIPSGVTSIGMCTFSYCTSITSVTIPNSVESIGWQAFYGCSGLNAIYCLNPEPPTCNNSFGGNEEKCVLWVPKESIESYKKANGWKDFKNIAAFSTIPEDGEKISGKCGNNVYYVYNKKTYTLTISGEGQIDSYDPNDVEYAPWYRYAGDIHSLFIESGVTSIGNWAFYECSNINSVTIPNSLTYIGKWAFCGCSNLTTMTIPNSVEKINWMAFEKCSSLTSLIIGNSVTDISDDAFQGCTSLTSIKVAEGNPKYDSRNNCNALIETSSNTLIMGCNNTIIPNGVTSISGSAFSGCSGLTSVSIPNSVTSIGISAFSGCSGLTSVTIPNSVTSIGDYAFSNCNGLTTIYSLNNTPSTCEQYYSDYYDYSDYYTQFNSVDKTNCILWVPKGCVNAYKEADGWKDFQNIVAFSTIPDDGEKISGKCGENVYYVYNKSTHNLTISGEGQMYSPLEAIDTPWYQYAGEIHSINIEPGVTVIGRNAFSGCSNLTSVTIPNSVTSIDKWAFYGCGSLTSVTIPNSVSSIGWYSFAYCRSLASVTIPNSVTSISEYAFHCCNSLTSIVVENGNTSYDSRGDCNALIETSTNTLINGCLNTVIPYGVTSIKDNAFRDCSNLTSITIPNSVTFIGDYAFYGCSGLASITIPNSVTYIGCVAFDGTAWYNNQPDGLVYAGKFAYKYKGEMPVNTRITIKHGTLGIANETFYDCSGLISVVIPNGVTFIGDYAFMHCSGLTSVTIPNSVTSIGYCAFEECSGLSTIYSLNNTPLTCKQYYNTQFNYVDKTKCVVWVPKGSVNAYREADGWKDFQNIKELTFGDVNIDFVVNQADLDATVDFTMDKDPEGFYENLADLNGDNKVDAVDVVKLVTILNQQEGLNMDWQAKYSNQVISSLSCTLNNDGDKAIQLTKCELYYNQSLVSSSNFKVTLASGGSKKCSFDELASYSTRTGFSLVWYYTYNGEEYTYRCEIEE